MLSDHDQTGADEPRHLEAELLRNRRRALRIVCAIIAAAVLWPLCSGWRSRQPAGPAIPALHPSAVRALPPRPESLDGRRKAVYRHSVIPGGAYSGKALSRAIANDRVVAAHYAGFDDARARPMAAPAGLRLYASYRIDNAVYWTAQPISLHPDETLLTDGVHLARARCGNRLSETPRTPVGPRVDLDEDADAQWRDAEEPWREPRDDEGIRTLPMKPRSRLSFELFPNAVLAEDRSLNEDATTAAAEVSTPNAQSFSYSIFTRRPLGQWWRGSLPTNPPVPPPPGTGEFPGGPGVSGMVSVWSIDLPLWAAPKSAAPVERDGLSISYADPALSPAGEPSPAPSFGPLPSNGGWNSFEFLFSGEILPGGTTSGGGGTSSGGGSGGTPAFDPPSSDLEYGSGDLPEVPEPAVAALLALGLAVLALARARYTAP